MSNDSVVVDHPERLGDLAPASPGDASGSVSTAAVGSSSSGPTRSSSMSGSALTRSRAAVAALAKVDPEQAETVGGAERPRSGVVKVRVDNELDQLVRDERRWSVEPVQRFLDRLREAGGSPSPTTSCWAARA